MTTAVYDSEEYTGSLGSYKTSTKSITADGGGGCEEDGVSISEMASSSVFGNTIEGSIVGRECF